MRRLLSGFKWFWGILVVGLILGVLGNHLYAHLPEALSVLGQYQLWILLLVLFMGALSLWSWCDHTRRQRQEETQKRFKAKEDTRREAAARDHLLRQEFALFKPVSELRPEDLGFHALKPGDTINPADRPIYPIYIPRRAIAYDHRTDPDGQYGFDEVHLAQELRHGRGLVLLGQPLEGKTRTLYEIVRQLTDYQVVQPMNRPTPPDEAFTLFQGARVILLLEDLNNYASGILDLREFAGKLRHYADTWAVAATCRDGPELGTVREAIGTSLRRFFEDIPLKLGLLPLMAAEKERLARSIGKAWGPQDSEDFPTPGSMTMAEALGAMRERFQSLDPEQKDTLWGLKLLTTAGILPHTHHRLQAILEHIFSRVVHLASCLDRLGEQSFIRRPARQDPIQPEPAYLQGAVAYLEGRTPEDDFPRLVNALEGMADAEGLAYLGNAYAASLGQYQNALDIYNRALQLRPDLPAVWDHKGFALERLERDEEALEAYDRALALAPDALWVWHRKSHVLEGLRRYEEALEAYDRVLQLAPAFSVAWFRKGHVLEELRRDEDALEAYDQALALDPNFSALWDSKGHVLERLERYEDALEAYDRALALAPDALWAWHSKGFALERLERYEEALEACDRALQLAPANPVAWSLRGLALTRLKRYPEALSAFERTLELRPDDAMAWHDKGVALGHLERHQEALEAFDRELQIHPNAPLAWYDKGLALVNLQRYEEALEAFDRALQLAPDLLGAWHHKGVALENLERHQEALQAYERARQLASATPTG
jgi:tetratricopeptide (TPR) repeat protein